MIQDHINAFIEEHTISFAQWMTCLVGFFAVLLAIPPVTGAIVGRG